MRKFLCTTVVLFLVFSTALFCAERLKLRSGSWQIGGAFSFLYAQAFTEISYPQFNIQLGGNAGYFMTRETIIGLTLGSSFELRATDTEPFINANLQSITLYFQYLVSTEESVNLFFAFGAGYAFDFETGPTVAENNQIKGNNMLIDLSIGLLIPLSQSVAIQIMFVPTMVIPLGKVGNPALVAPLYFGITAFIY